jgi:hypothetical protein
MEKPLTAAEFKRRFMNKKAIARAGVAVDVRSALGVLPGVAKDKKRLRQDWQNRNPNPGTFYSERQACLVGTPLVSTGITPRSHLATSF